MNNSPPDAPPSPACIFCKPGIFSRRWVVVIVSVAVMLFLLFYGRVAEGIL